MEDPMTTMTLYLPVDLKDAISRAAKREGLSEEELIRRVLEAKTTSRPKPRAGIFASDELIGSRVDEPLDGFGED